MSLRPLAAADLLAVWERGYAQRPAHQALTLLAAASADASAEDLARLTIGQRDGLLLALRAATFGARCTSVAACPLCGDRLEVAFDVADICVPPTIEPSPIFTLAMGEYEVQFRLPNSLDILALSSIRDEETGRRVLLDRCIMAARRDGQETAVAELPPEAVAAVVTRMGEADPQGDVQLALTCPACGHPWSVAFDIVTFFWAEIQAWAYRLLGEIHTLAAAYGWREADILALTPWRRQIYVGMIAG